MSLKLDAKKQNVAALVDLYVLDLNSIGLGQVYYFYPGTDANNQPVTYQGSTYTPWPIEMTGFEKRGTGSESRPKARISNDLGTITAQLLTHDDLIGATIKRRRTLKTYLINNIPDYVEELYFVEQKVVENATYVEFDMANAMDFVDKQLPGRIAVANACPWRYKSTANGSGCSWAGTDSSKWFDSNGNSVNSAAMDNCGKRVTDCKLRFGANNELDFGGFPSLGRNG